MLMTACDLGAVTKPWEISCKVDALTHNTPQMSMGINITGIGKKAKVNQILNVKLWKLEMFIWQLSEVSLLKYKNY